MHIYCIFLICIINANFLHIWYCLFPTTISCIFEYNISAYLNLHIMVYLPLCIFKLISAYLH